MGKCFLGFPNRIGGQDVGISGGGWSASLPLSNILDRTPTIVARSVDLLPTNTLFDIDFGAAKQLKCFSIVNHNMSRSAIWRVTLGSSQGGSDIHDTGWLPIWYLTFDNDLLEWEDSGWWEGSYDDEYIGHPFSAIHIMPGWHSSRYIRFEFYDVSNNLGYIQIGRVFAGGGISPKHNMVFGMSDYWEDNSVVEQSIGGSEYFDARRRARNTRFSLDLIDTPVEFRQFYEMQRRLGICGEVLYVPDDEDMLYSQLTGYVGRLRQLSEIEYPFYNLRAMPFDLKELL